MSTSPDNVTTKPLNSCRRKGIRHPLPVEVRIRVADREISGIVRDVTIDSKEGPQAIGISLLHYEPLSAHTEYQCKTLTEVQQLPAEFKMDVRWCRYFEDEAFISGGVVS